MPGFAGPTSFRSHIQTMPTMMNAIAIICAAVNGPKNRSSFARKNSMMNRSIPASTQ
jgi:hypothetical protein